MNTVFMKFISAWIQQSWQQLASDTDIYQLSNQTGPLGFIKYIQRIM